jgi:hypothetical protein
VKGAQECPGYESRRSQRGQLVLALLFIVRCVKMRQSF